MVDFGEVQGAVDHLAETNWLLHHSLSASSTLGNELLAFLFSPPFPPQVSFRIHCLNSPREGPYSAGRSRRWTTACMRYSGGGGGGISAGLKTGLRCKAGWKDHRAAHANACREAHVSRVRFVSDIFETVPYTQRTLSGRTVIRAPRAHK